MKNKTTSVGIISNGKFEDSYEIRDLLKTMDILIAADGGANHCFKLDVDPDIIIGDMDSITPKVKRYFISHKSKFISFPVDKDKTDTELAITEAMKMDPKEIYFFSYTGGRHDHLLANIFILENIIKKNISAIIVNKKTSIQLINKKQLHYNFIT